MKKQIILVSIIIASCISGLSAQNYNSGVGLRGGLFNGITAKHFVGSSTAFEGLLSFRWQGVNITGLYEIHNELSPSNLVWYYGFGAHLGFFDGYDGHPWADEGKSYLVIGADGIIGIEYTFDEVPVNVSLDWKPAINLIGYNGFWGDTFAISIRYVW